MKNIHDNGCVLLSLGHVCLEFREEKIISRQEWKPHRKKTCSMIKHVELVTIIRNLKYMCHT